VAVWSARDRKWQIYKVSYGAWNVGWAADDTVQVSRYTGVDYLAVPSGALLNGRHRASDLSQDQEYSIARNDEGMPLSILEDGARVELTYAVAQIAGSLQTLGRVRWAATASSGHLMAGTVCGSSQGSQGWDSCYVSFMDVARLQELARVRGALVGRSAIRGDAVVLRNDSLLFVSADQLIKGKSAPRGSLIDTARVSVAAESWNSWGEGQRRQLGTWTMPIRAGDHFGPKIANGGDVGEGTFRVVSVDSSRVIADCPAGLAPSGLRRNPLNDSLSRRFVISDSTIQVGTISYDGGITMSLRRVREPAEH
jgi:hypothetical protein